MGSNLLHSHRYGGLAVDELAGGSERPALVLLHGLSFDRSMWRPALQQLAAIDPDRRAIAIDLPGHGESPDDDSYDLVAVVDRIRGAVSDAAIEAPVLVGHSASTATVAQYAILGARGETIAEPDVEVCKAFSPTGVAPITAEDAAKFTPEW